jgi:hypothetical protein
LKKTGKNWIEIEMLYNVFKAVARPNAALRPTCSCRFQTPAPKKMSMLEEEDKPSKENLGEQAADAIKSTKKSTSSSTLLKRKKIIISKLLNRALILKAFVFNFRCSLKYGSAVKW